MEPLSAAEQTPCPGNRVGPEGSQHRPRRGRRIVLVHDSKVLPCNSTIHAHDVDDIVIPGLTIYLCRGPSAACSGPCNVQQASSNVDRASERAIQACGFHAPSDVEQDHAEPYIRFPPKLG